MQPFPSPFVAQHLGNAVAVNTTGLSLDESRLEHLRIALNAVPMAASLGGSIARMASRTKVQPKAEPKGKDAEVPKPTAMISWPPVATSAAGRSVTTAPVAAAPAPPRQSVRDTKRDTKRDSRAGIVVGGVKKLAASRFAWMTGSATQGGAVPAPRVV